MITSTLYHVEHCLHSQTIYQLRLLSHCCQYEPIHYQRID